MFFKQRTAYEIKECDWSSDVCSSDLLSTVDGHLTPPDLARKIPGCLGARMTGGGFGGCTVNLVSSDAVSSFQSTIRDSYRRETDRNPEIYISPPPAGRGNYDSRKNRERGGG